MKALPSQRTFCVHHATMHHFTMSFYSKPHTKDARVFRCNLPPHFWQNDRDLIRATAVTRGWNGHFNNNNNNNSIAVISGVQKLTALYNKSQHRKVDPGEKGKQKQKTICRSCRDSNPRPFHHESVALPLSYPRSPHFHVVLSV